VLRQIYSDVAEIHHEPIHYKYRPRSTLRARNFTHVAEEVDDLRHHLSHIDALVRSGGSYIDTGWSVFPWIPYFIDRYGPIVRVIHLTRHPVYFALSLETHGFYNLQVRNDGYIQHAQLDPTDPGVLHKEYLDRWHMLSRFEKCLFQWLEIHAYALELQREYPEVPFLRLRMEDLAASDAAWMQMTDFFGFPSREAQIRQLRQDRVDKFHWKLDAISDPKLIYGHPAVLNLMAGFGYDAGDIDRKGIASRYKRPWHYRTFVRIAKRAIPGRYHRPVAQMAHRFLEF
jgi:hypothetical protein